MQFVQSQTDSKYCSNGLDSQGLSKHEALQSLHPYYCNGCPVFPVAQQKIEKMKSPYIE